VPSASVVTIPQSTRRFLEPLVGVDPSSVRVLLAPPGAAETRGADALTLGDDIVLAAGQAGASPQALGLLAHELTHVALARGGNVTPPIAQDPSAPDRPAESLDEESLARRVEARVIGAAETLAGPASSTAPTSDGPLQLTPRDVAPAGPGPVPGPTPASQAAEDDIWGGLPKPWEPLPAWMTDPTPPVGMSMSTNFAAAWDSAPTNGSSAPSVAPPSAPAATGEGGGAQMAELGRDVQPQQQASQAGPGGPAGQVPPDLDALAQQVYAILRRRISAESRRFR
jgi:hypothetical protein